MTTMTDPPQVEGFRIGQLINDTRYRSYTFQFIALVCLILGFSWLAYNASQNDQLQSNGFSYEFLYNPAGYDINQQPIPYTSQDTHLRATIIGAINTIIVAFLACVTATIFGVIAGVLRLSNNWIISKLMSVYVEMFRNIPVLIWIIIIFTVAANTFPPISEFRLPRDGSDPERGLLFGMFAATNQGVFVPRLVFADLGWIVAATFLASIAGVFGWKAHAKRKLYGEGKEVPVLGPSLAILLVPTIVVYFILGMPVSLENPEMGRFRFEGGFLLRPSLIALWFALSIYTGAFIAENVRAGILAISKGQSEAAAALGLRPGRIMSLVVLPQALRVIIPPLISQYLNITKNTSLAIAVGYMDLTGTLGGITLNQTGRALECILLLMLFYLTFSLAISAIMNVYNNSVKLKER
ncbi:amino acid ABC transporter permease [Jannaschia pagri]|uniref:Amino acid ABC transporter permease n=1 Tax=Jannaschia pagri TaxID=2829797 RepID=A0ABQ4NHM0_9RHOB|nr:MULTISPECIES: ABC transporter permease subunit [unclassified Jannaschia]GIT90312.1 amino acid ABC transporter permease [Jannaschia sp. AI_61]GIT93582.1 amino acid ABC transporter permease [Jannaschia sp. AI_62]